MMSYDILNIPLVLKFTPFQTLSESPKPGDLS